MTATNNGSAVRAPRVYVAGHSGMVGSAIVRQLLDAGHPAERILTRTHAELDLTDQVQVRAFFQSERPDQVYLAAAKVGGIHANNTYPAEFIYQNLMIQANVIQAAHMAGVQRLLFLGSSCIYPRDCPQPMREDYLLTNQLYRRPAELAAKAAQSVPQDILDVLWRVQMPFLDSAFALAEQHAGSMDRYLTEVLGVDAAARQRLAQRYLEG